jgi:hypothetical protein
VSVVLVVTWIASARVLGMWVGERGHYIEVHGGTALGVVYTYKDLFNANPGTLWCTGRFGWRWWFNWQRSDGSLWIQVPLWSFVVLVLAPTATAWRLDTLARRRARLNHCPTCNYSRADLPAASPCPECGKRPSRPEHADTQARTPMS